MSEFRYICGELYRGKSVLRAYLNFRLKEESLFGKTIDIGGGGGSAYLSALPRESNVTFENFDLKVGNNVDFEKDSLPAPDAAYDTVLFLNVMEHIFNYQHIANEVVRIVKPGGQLIGYVPFLMWYHPDHKDFFRYTHEALQIIFERAGAKNIKIEAIARGPFTVCAQMTVLMLPKILRPVLFTPMFMLDRLFLRFQNKPDKRHVLGYFFTLTK
jgi:SAM-dependent methyltransferase